MNMLKSTVATSAMPIGMPGCPEPDFSTASMESALMALAISRMETLLSVCDEEDDIALNSHKYIGNAECTFTLLKIKINYDQKRFCDLLDKKRGFTLDLRSPELIIPRLQGVNCITIRERGIGVSTAIRNSLTSLNQAIDNLDKAFLKSESQKQEQQQELFAAKAALNDNGTNNSGINDKNAEQFALRLDNASETVERLWREG